MTKKKYKALDEWRFISYEAQGIQVIPSIHKRAIHLLVEPEKHRAILHCGKHGEIYLNIDDMQDVLNEALDILAHMGY